MFRKAIQLVFLSLAFGLGSAQAEDRAGSVAQIRAELEQLAAQLQSLKGELIGGGQAAIAEAGGTTALDRLAAMEAELARLTAAAEQAQIRIEKVVADGTNRVGDLEFRLCELEEGCDPANLPVTASLGGAVAGGASPPPVTPTSSEAPGAPKVELAINEQADFDRAKAKLDVGDYQGAAVDFAAFAQNYPGGPLTGEALFLQGEALSRANDTAAAARAYLAAFSGSPQGPRAPAALLRLGAALGLLGQTQDACVTLGEVPTRFPSSPEASEAKTAMQQLACP